MFHAPFLRRRFDLSFGIWHTFLTFVDGVMNVFSLHIEPPSYVSFK